MDAHHPHRLQADRKGPTLGDLCRVHRGQVTGANAVWIAGAWPGRLPDRFLVPAVTRARELLQAAGVLRAAARLRRVIDLPASLDGLDPDEGEAVARFLDWAAARGARDSYIAANRRAWWSVGLRAPAPILCTYMARRPPAFVRNLCGARHLNIAHGLYPRQPLGEAQLMGLVAYLSGNVRTDAGRTYAGGLTKFEPGELERLPIPRLGELHEFADNMGHGSAEAGRGAGGSAVPSVPAG